MSIKDIVKKGLEEIINNPDYKDLPKDFLIDDSDEFLKPNAALLFIGINPSQEKKGLKQKWTRKTHPYFKKFNDISESCNIDWTHLDLLFFRETNQNKVFEILKKENGKEYIRKQLKIADELIKLCKPKAIIVCNTLARKFLGKDNKDGDKDVCLNYKFKPDEKMGIDIWNDNIPVFFSSMLSGQRALDLGSYERLKWHINWVLKIKK